MHGSQSDSWTELATKPHLENEELIIAHTYLNAQVGQFVNDSNFDDGSQKDYKLKFIDHDKIEQMGVDQIYSKDQQRVNLRTNNSEDDLVLKDNIQPITVHRQQNPTKSIIKVPFSNYKIEADPVSDSEEEK